MEPTVRVTEKGQVTIPKAIRDKLGIVPGSEVTFVEKGNVVEFSRNEPATESAAERRARLGEHFEKMRGTLDLKGMTTDEYMERLRGPRDDLDAR